jgi:dienelactone hydrolase
MAFSFKCSQCGRVHTMSEGWAGKVLNCEGCGKAMRIPTPRKSAPMPPGKNDDLDDPGVREEPEALATFPRAARRTPPAAQAGTMKAPSNVAKADSLSAGVKGILGAAGGFLVLLAVFGFRIYRANHRFEVVQDRRAAKAIADAPPTPSIVPSRVAPPARRPWTLPVLPEPGEGVELEPGVWFYEVRLPGSLNSGIKTPGHSGKLWLYLPDGDHATHSLPCVLIAGAGSNLITGMDLGDGDRPEHLPYVRDGFAVIAYELDGALPDPKPTNDAQFATYVRSFVDADAGLVNMRVAIAYATSRVPSIDPDRLFAVGHSSAATLALLVAENEPRIAACVAFAPVIDIKESIPTQLQQALGQLVPGADELFTRFNPAANVEKIECPLFLFVALDDRYPQQDQDLVRRLHGLGKAVTFVTVSNGGHYEPMIQKGIPRAVLWLKGVHRRPDGSIVAPKSAPVPRAKTPTRRLGPNPKAPRVPGVRRPRGTTPNQE